VSLRRLLWLSLLGFLPFSSQAQVSAIYPSRTTMITGECEADLKPSVAVISGGVATSALTDGLVFSIRLGSDFAA